MQKIGLFFFDYGADLASRFGCQNKMIPRSMVSTRVIRLAKNCRAQGAEHCEWWEEWG